jgi:DNA-binding transcriptional LysR family regulator
LSIRYTGGSLLSVLNYISETDALAILPLSVAYSVNRDKRLAVLPLDIPQPERMIGIVSKRSDRMNPACAKFSKFISVELAKFNTVIGRYEKTINWGRGPFMAETIR